MRRDVHGLPKPLQNFAFYRKNEAFGKGRSTWQRRGIVKQRLCLKSMHISLHGFCTAQSSTKEVLRISQTQCELPLYRRI